MGWRSKFRKRSKGFRRQVVRKHNKRVRSSTPVVRVLESAHKVPPVRGGEPWERFERYFRDWPRLKRA